MSDIYYTPEKQKKQLLFGKKKLQCGNNEYFRKKSRFANDIGNDQYIRRIRCSCQLSS